MIKRRTQILAPHWQQVLSVAAIVICAALVGPPQLPGAQAAPASSVPETDYYLIHTSGTNYVGTDDDSASGGMSCTLRDALGIVNVGTTSGPVNGCSISAVGTPVDLTYVIELPAGAYTYTLSHGELLTSANTVYVVGDAAANTILQANSAASTATYRVWRNHGATVEIINITLRHGECTGTCLGAGTVGGGIFNASGTVTLVASAVNANLASHGGGIGTLSGATTTVDASTVSSNTATYSGGGIYNEGTLNVQNGSTVGAEGAANSAINGGGIYNFSGTVTVDASTVTHNSAVYGGGIQNQSTLSVQSYSTISDNTATGAVNAAGGGIANNSGATTTVDSSTVSRNEARYAGGIYNFEGTLIIQNGSTLSDNVVSRTGGGIYTYSGTMTVDGSIIQSNSADVGASAVYLGGTSTINNSCILLNGTEAVYDELGGADVTGNWWGATDGPGPPHGPGSGDGYYTFGTANYAPFLTGPPAICSPAFVVNSDDDGNDGACDATHCSLREAIAAANAIPGTDTIEFAIAGAGPHTIQPLSALPAISEAVIIDGYTQSGAAVATASTAAVLMIELDGSLAGSPVDGLTLTGGGSTVKGLVINRFTGSGILLQTAGGNTIEGNHIGTDVAGTADLGNGSVGVWADGVPNNTIGGTSPAARNVISGNGSRGVYLWGPAASGNVVQGNFIGTDASGTLAIANRVGVLVRAAPNNTIGGTASGAGNLISGNMIDGVGISRYDFDIATGNIVQGNLIGTDVTGTLALGNGGCGISLGTTNDNTIGGTNAAARNIISANGFSGYGLERQSGIAISSGISYLPGNLIQGNYIGTDITGSLALGNKAAGIILAGVTGNTIGGTAPGAGNLISGNQYGLVLTHYGSAPSQLPSQDNVVQGNFIGTDVTGTSPLGNRSRGVQLSEAQNNTIGGTTSGAANIISGNQGDGLAFISNVTGNVVQGNFIGTDASGSFDLGNDGDGLYIFSSAQDNIIGGSAAGAANTIAFNTDSGIQVLAPAVDNPLQRNSIFSNGGLGIDLGATTESGLTPNDPGDLDSGGNNLQNFPVLSSARSDGVETEIDGALNSAASTTYTLEFFSNTVCDPSGNGEGEVFLGSTEVTTDVNGNASFSTALSATADPDSFVTATATDPAGNTSEFSACMPVIVQAFCSTVMEIPPEECEALVALYYSTHGHNWADNSDWLQTDTPCSTPWFGLTCVGGHITQIILSENQLNGSIPPELGGLANLQQLSLQGNQLSGNIPPELGELASLKRLFLHDNQLSGEIPTQLRNLTSLEWLYLYDNQISGDIPPELGELAGLQRLYLQNNELTGGIPPALGNLVNLRQLYLTDNQLSGEIPPDLGNLVNLQYLSLHSNQLSEGIPPELGNLVILEKLWLNDNQLTGNIPSQFGNLTKLEWLYLYNNHLNGTIPPELGALVSLQRLFLQNNALQGDIPASIANLTGLEATDLRYNMLTASDPVLIEFLDTKHPNWADTQTVPPTDVQVVDLTRDSVALSWAPIAYTGHDGHYEVHYATTQGGPYQLHGTTADKNATGYTAGGLSPGTTYYFVVHTYTPAHGDQQNELLSVASQEVEARPSHCSDVTELPQAECEALVALYNSTSGDNWVDNTGWLETDTPCSTPWFGLTCVGGHVQTIDLEEDNLAGPLPSEMGNLSHLEILRLGENHLSGTIPPELGNMSNLVALGLTGNDLVGSIPPELGNLASLETLGLNRNDLSGEIPPELGNLSNLRGMVLYNNNLTGSIPPELGQLENLEFLYLWFNELSGDIPPELGDLPILRELRLESNQLTGEIPPELGNLTTLEQLHLDRNQLSGAIPPELGALSNLEQLHLFYNQLSGEIPPELGSLGSLQELYLEANYLSGEIPPELGALSGMTHLRLSQNALEGEIPSSLVNLASLISADFGYNMLTASDLDLIEFLNTTDPDWANTQTVPPDEFRVASMSDTSITLEWMPILYQGDVGHYEIGYLSTQDGSFVPLGTTANKAVSTFEVSRESALSNILAIRSFTERHSPQRNDLLSAYTVIPLSEDADGDGITNAIDTLPFEHSDDFSDGILSGSIVDRGEQDLIVRPFEQGNIVIEAHPSGGDAPAEVLVWDADGGEARIYDIHRGDVILVEGGSITIGSLVGDVDVEFTATDGTIATASLVTDNSLTFDPVEVTFTAPPDNPEPVVVTVGEEELVVEPDETVEYNHPPVCTSAEPNPDTLWPANHEFVSIDVLGVTDADGDTTAITIDSIFQDEPVDAPGSGNTSPDGQGVGTATAEVRAERVGSGNGRYYHIGFTADDGQGATCSGEVLVGVPKNQGKKGAPVDDGPLHDSTALAP